MKNLIYILAIVFLIVLFLTKKKKDYEAEFEKIVGNLRKKGLSDDLLKRIEQIYRFETGNFKAKIFLNTLGTGAIAYGAYPYGFDITKKVQTAGVYKSSNGHKYIKFATLQDGVVFLGLYLEKGTIDGRTELWGSAKGYLSAVKKIKTKYS